MRSLYFKKMAMIGCHDGLEHQGGLATENQQSSSSQAVTGDSGRSAKMDQDWITLSAKAADHLLDFFDLVLCGHLWVV